MNAAEQSAVVVTGTTAQSLSSVVTISFSDGVNTITKIATVTNTGDYSITPADISSLQEGPITVSVVETDLAGNVSPTVSTTITKDTVSPSTVVINTPIAGDNYVNNAEKTSVVISGSGVEQTATVQVTFTDSSSNSITVSATNNGDGTYTLPATDISSLVDGTITVTVAQTDAAGNLGSSSTTTFAKDSSTPSNITITAPQDGSYINNAQKTAVVVSGTSGEVSSTVRVTFTDSSTNTLSITASVISGVYNTASADISLLSDGQITITAVETDLAGNSGTPVSITVTKDTVIPSSVTVTSPLVGEMINNAEKSTVVVTGSGVEFPTSTVIVTFTDSSSNSITVTATNNGDGTFTVPSTDISSLVDGAITVSVTQTDLSGNTSPSTDVGVIKDAITPASVTINTPIAGDNVVNDAEKTSVVISGSGVEQTATVQVTFTDSSSNSITVSATNNGDGTYTLPATDISSLVDGTITVTVAQTDAAGNLGSSSTITITKDTVSPSPIAINTPIAGDNVVNDAEKTSVVISGSGVEQTATVQVTFTDSSSNSITVTATNNGDGTYTLPATDISSLVDGTITVTVAQTDAAGNLGSSSTTTITKDTEAPTMLTANTPIEGDNIVNINEQSSVVVSGSNAEATSTVTVKFTDSQGNSVDAPSVIVNPDGKWIAADTDLSSLQDGPIIVSVVETDAAGNSASPVIANISKDTVTPPATLTVNTPIMGDGSINVNEITQAIISGTGAISGASITVTFSDGVNTPITVSAVVNNVDGTYAIPPTSLASLNQGTIDIVVSEVSSSGNQGPIIILQALIDTIAPNTIQIITPIESDNVINLSEQSSVDIYGTNILPTSSVLLIATDGTNTLQFNAVVSGSTWSVTSVDLSSLKDGPIVITAVETDAAGNVGSAATVNTSKDTDVPSSVTINTPIAGDNVVNNAEKTSVVISGSGVEQTATVQVTFTDSSSNSITVSATNNGDGTYTLPATDISSLVDGTITVTVAQTDTAGNLGSSSTTTITKDTVSPSLTIIVDTVGQDNIISSTEQTSVVVSGSQVEFPSSIQVTFTDSHGTTIVVDTIANPDGTFSFPPTDITNLSDGVITLSVIETDAAGNPSSTVTETIFKDISAPNNIRILNPKDGEVINSNSASAVAVLGDQLDSVDSTVQIIFSDGVSTITNSGLGNIQSQFSSRTNIQSLNEGFITITAIETDFAGNVGSPVSITVLKDTTAPTSVFVNTPIEGDNIVNINEQSSVVVFGSDAEATSTISVKFTDSLGNSVDAPSVIVDSDGKWIAADTDLSSLQDGPITVSVVETDAAGNSASPVITTISKDTVTPPATLTVNTPIMGDGSINVNEITQVIISGTGAISGASITVTFSDGINTPITVSAVVNNVDGTYAIPPTSLASLNQGTIDIVVSEVSSSGNQGPVIILQALIDTIAPNTIQIITPIESDNVINLSEQSSVDIYGTNILPTSSVLLIATDGTNTLQFNAVVSGSTWSVTSVDFSSLKDGPIVITAVETDAAGNVGSAATVNISKDSVIPTGITVITPISGDNYVNSEEQTSIVVSGTSSEPTSTVVVEFTDSNGNTISVPAVVNQDGTYSIDPTNVSPLADGTITVVVIETDSVGNPAAPVTTTFIKDTVDPISVVITNPTVDQVENTNTLSNGVSVSGTGEPGSSIQVTFTDPSGNTITVPVTVNVDGTFNIPPTDITPLIDGVITITVVETDPSGNVGTPSTVTITKDSTPPTGLVVDSPIEGDNNINNIEEPSITVTGSGAEPGSSIQVTFIDPSGNSITVPGIVNVDGTFNIPPTDITPLNDGVITITVIETDPSGNPGEPIIIHIPKDTFAPTGLLVNTPIEGDNIVNINEQSSVVVSGSNAEATATVTVKFTDSLGNSVDAPFVIVDSDGKWIAADTDLSSLQDGPIIVSVVETDAAGNSASPVIVNISKDTITPPATLTVDIPIMGDGMINANEISRVVISGTGAMTRASITVTFSDGVNTPITVSAVVNNVDGTYAIPPTSLASLNQGTIDIVVSEVSSSGNQGPIITLQALIDTIAPNTIQIITPIESDNVINLSEQSSVDIYGTNILPTSSVLVTATDGTNTLQFNAVVSGSTWSVTSVDLSSLKDGPIVITAVETDAAGNVGPAATVNISKDTLSPSSLTIDTPIAEDNIINNSEKSTVIVTGSGVESQATVVLTFTDSFGKSVRANAIITGASFAIPPTDLTSLADGTITITAVETDKAGNSAAVSVSVTKDTISPINLIVNVPISGDNIVNRVEALGVVVSGSNAASGAKVIVSFIDSNNNVITVNALVNSDGTWEIPPKDISSLIDGTVTVSVYEISSSGNPSSPQTIQIQKDTVPPSLFSITVPIAGDNIVNNNEATSLIVTGINGDPSSTLIVTFTDANGSMVTVTAVIDQNGNWRIPSSSILGLVEGNVIVSAVETDLAGNSISATPVTVQLIKNSSTTITISTPIAVDNVINTIEQNGLVITGFVSDPLSSIVVEFVDSNGNTIRVNGVVDSSGNWRIPSSSISSLANGVISITAYATDRYGFIISSSPVEVVLDSSAPSGLTINTPIEGDNIITQGEIERVHVTGFGAEGNSIIRVTFTDSALHEITVTAIVGLDGSWSISPVDLSPLLEGPISISATEIDAAGNVGVPASVVATILRTITPSNTPSPSVSPSPSHVRHLVAPLEVNSASVLNLNSLLFMFIGIVFVLQ